MVKTARFIGRDGSMGLRHGRYYEITIYGKPDEDLIFVEWIGYDGFLWKCPYGSIEALMQNWLF